LITNISLNKHIKAIKSSSLYCSVIKQSNPLSYVHLLTLIVWLYHIHQHIKHRIEIRQLAGYIPINMIY